MYTEQGSDILPSHLGLDQRSCGEVEHGVVGAPGNPGEQHPLLRKGGWRGDGGVGRFLEGGEGRKACKWVRADVLVWGVDR